MEIFLKIYRVDGPNGKQLQVAAFETMQSACDLVHPQCSIARLHLKFKETHNWQVLKVEEKAKTKQTKSSKSTVVKQAEKLVLNTESLEKYYNSSSIFSSISTGDTHAFRTQANKIEKEIDAVSFLSKYASFSKETKLSLLRWAITGYNVLKKYISDIGWSQVVNELDKNFVGKYVQLSPELMEDFHVLPELEKLKVLAEYVTKGMLWSTTIQGHEYWSNIYNKINKAAYAPPKEVEETSLKIVEAFETPPSSTCADFIKKYSSLSKPQQIYVIRNLLVWYPPKSINKDKRQEIQLALYETMEKLEKNQAEPLPEGMEKDLKSLPEIEKLNLIHIYTYISFSWDKSPQGLQYWLDIMKFLKEKIAQAKEEEEKKTSVITLEEFKKKHEDFLENNKIKLLYSLLPFVLEDSVAQEAQGYLGAQGVTGIDSFSDMFFDITSLTFLDKLKLAEEYLLISFNWDDIPPSSKYWSKLHDTLYNKIKEQSKESSNVT